MQWISEYTSLVLHFFKIWGLLLFSSFLHSYSFNKNLVPLFYLNFCKYILFHLDIVTCHFSEWPQNKQFCNAAISIQILYLPFTLFSLDVSYFHWTLIPVLMSCHSAELSQIDSALLQIQHKSCTSLSTCFSETHVSMSWLLPKSTWDGFPM